MYRMAIVKITSCSGCINELIYSLISSPTIFNNYKIVYFTELVDSVELGEDIDIVFIEGSIVNSKQENIVRDVRKRAKFIVLLGTCAVFGGVQATRVGENIEVVKGSIYPNPSYIDVYNDVKSVDSVVQIDFVFPGCPVNGEAIAMFLKKYALGGLPIAIHENVCGDCKRRGVECLAVSKGVPCLGPVTSSGCGAICPSFNRGCYGCFGIKMFDLDKEKLKNFVNVLKRLGMAEGDIEVLLKGFSYKFYSKFSSR